MLLTAEVNNNYSNKSSEKLVFERGRKIKLNGIFVKFTLSLYYYIIYVFTIDKNVLNSFRHTKLIKINQLLPWDSSTCSPRTHTRSFTVIRLDMEVTLYSLSIVQRQSLQPGVLAA